VAEPKPVSIKIDAGLVARVDKFAAAGGMDRATAAILLIERGLDGEADAPSARSAPTPARDFGPARAAPGSRLKKSGK
jgi:hypothetical protein